MSARMQLECMQLEDMYMIMYISSLQMPEI